MWILVTKLGSHGWAGNTPYCKTTLPAPTPNLFFKLSDKIMGFCIAFSCLHAILPLFVFLCSLPLPSSTFSASLYLYQLFTYVVGERVVLIINISMEWTTEIQKSLEAGNVIVWCPTYARQFLDEAGFLLEAKKQKNTSRMWSSLVPGQSRPHKMFPLSGSFWRTLRKRTDQEGKDMRTS